MKISLFVTCVLLLTFDLCFSQPSFVQPTQKLYPGVNLLSIELHNSGDLPLRNVSVVLNNIDSQQHNSKDVLVDKIEIGDTKNVCFEVLLEASPTWKEKLITLLIKSNETILATRSIFFVVELRTASSFELAQNYPNPFNPETNINFSLPAGEESNQTFLSIFDSQGKEIRSFDKGKISQGTYTVRWDSKNDAGAPVASGVYYYRLINGSYQITKKMVLIK